MYTQPRGEFKPQPAGARSVPLFVAGRAKPVAFVNGRTLTKGIRPQHFLSKPPGAIAFDESVLTEAARLGATDIEVRDLERGTVYRCNMADWERYSFFVGRGYGRQWALEPGRWSVNGAPPVLSEREKAQAARDSQLSLFELEPA